MDFGRRWRLISSKAARGILLRLAGLRLSDRINRRLLMSLLEGYQASALLHVAGRLRIADLLAHGPSTSGELARLAGADPFSMHRFLRGLVLLGICSEEEDGRFAITRLGSFLQDTKPHSLRAKSILTGDSYRVWGNLLHSVKTGGTASAVTFGTDAWTRRIQEPELDEAFNRAFEDGGGRISREILSAYDLSGVRVIADIGGGYGYLLGSILRNSLSLSGILFDQPHVIAHAGPYLNKTGISERCHTVGGDFFAQIPEGADIYMLKSVIHDWNDKQSVSILKNCRKALKPEGRLLLIERLMPVRAKDDPPAVFLDLRMLVSTGGRERTEVEFRMLFEAAGLTLTRIIPLPSGLNIIEGMAGR